MKKILITGASGFIGSFLVEEALKHKYEVFAALRTTSSKKYLKDPRIKFFEINLSDKDSIKNQLNRFSNEYGQFDYVIHNAGLTKSIKKKEFNKVNYQFTRNLVEALIETNNIPHKFIFVSSLAAMGPGKETDYEPINENDVTNPISLYGKSKLNAEIFLSGIRNFPFLIFRPTGVYGPREQDYLMMYKMINNHIETYIGTETQRLSFIYVKDLAALIVRALSSVAVRKSYLVSDGHTYSSLEFSEIVKQLLKKKTIKLVFPKLLVKYISVFMDLIIKITGKVSTLNSEKYKEISCENWSCNSESTQRDFHFKPQYNLYRGLNETISWCKIEKLL